MGLVDEHLNSDRCGVRAQCRPCWCVAIGCGVGRPAAVDEDGDVCGMLFTKLDGCQLAGFGVGTPVNSFNRVAGTILTGGMEFDPQSLKIPHLRPRARSQKG